MNMNNSSFNWLLSALDLEKIDINATVLDLNTVRGEVKTAKHVLCRMSALINLLMKSLLPMQGFQENWAEIDDEGGDGLITFTTYIFNQRNREDPVGDLARKAWADPDFPKMAQPAAIERYLKESMASSNMMPAFQQAAAEYYEKEVKHVRRIPVR